MADLTVNDVALRYGEGGNPQGRVGRGAGGQSGCPARPLRQRQDDLVARGRRSRNAHRGSIRIGDNMLYDADNQDRDAGRSTRARPRVPILRALAPPDGIRERRLWSQAAPRSPAQKSRRESPMCWRRSGWRISASVILINCRAANSSASRSRARWFTSLRSFCSMSRCRTSMPSCGRRPAPGCARLSFRSVFCAPRHPRSD